MCARSDAAHESGTYSGAPPRSVSRSRTEKELPMTIGSKIEALKKMDARRPGVPGEHLAVLGLSLIHI